MAGDVYCNSGTGRFYMHDGSAWNADGIIDGDKGDLTVSSDGATWTVDADAISYSKIQDVSATDRLLGRVSASSGIIEEIEITDFVQTILNDASASDVRTTLACAATASPTFTGNVAITIPSTNTTAGTTQTIDWDNGNAQVFDAQGSSGSPIVFTFSNPKSGASYVLKLIQGSTARTYTWPGTVKWPGGTAPTVTATDNAEDLCTFFWDGTNYLGNCTLDHR